MRQTIQTVDIPPEEQTYVGRRRDLRFQEGETIRLSAAAAAAESEGQEEEEDESRYGARKVSDVELEVSTRVRRGVDRALLMHALTDLNVAVGDAYKRIEFDILSVGSEARHMRMRTSDCDVIDGPRGDIAKQVRDVLLPYCEKAPELLMHELRFVSDVLKIELDGLM